MHPDLQASPRAHRQACPHPLAVALVDAMHAVDTGPTGPDRDRASRYLDGLIRAAWLLGIGDGQPRMRIAVATTCLAAGPRPTDAVDLDEWTQAVAGRLADELAPPTPRLATVPPPATAEPPRANDPAGYGAREDAIRAAMLKNVADMATLMEDVLGDAASWTAVTAAGPAAAAAVFDDAVRRWQQHAGCDCPIPGSRDPRPAETCTLHGVTA